MITIEPGSRILWNHQHFTLSYLGHLEFRQLSLVGHGPGSLAPFVRGKCRAVRLEAAYAGRIMQGLEQCGASGQSE